MGLPLIPKARWAGGLERRAARGGMGVDHFEDARGARCRRGGFARNGLASGRPRTHGRSPRPCPWGDGPSVLPRSATPSPLKPPVLFPTDSFPRMYRAGPDRHSVPSIQACQEPSWRPARPSVQQRASEPVRETGARRLTLLLGDRPRPRPRPSQSQGGRFRGLKRGGGCRAEYGGRGKRGRGGARVRCGRGGRWGELVVVRMERGWTEGTY